MKKNAFRLYEKKRSNRTTRRSKEDGAKQYQMSSADANEATIVKEVFALDPRCFSGQLNCPPSSILTDS